MQFTPAMNDGKAVFVFGSNLAGVHGAGAAREAHRFWGAAYGIGIGRTGFAYAIPTKDDNIQSLTLPRIQAYVNGFLEYARQRPHLRFLVTAIGTGLAGYTHKEIAPMFKGATPNCVMPTEWEGLL